MMKPDYDVIVIGAGMVGAAVAYGLAGKGRKVLVLDGADTDYRAAKANFGLVWVQGKGYGVPAYQILSRQSARLWPGFSKNLEDETGIALDYDNRGGLHFCLGEQEWEQRKARLDDWHTQAEGEPSCVRMLDREQLQAAMSDVRLGPEVSGASLGLADGHVNPLKLLAALHAGLLRRRAQIRTNCPATGIEPLTGGGFAVVAGGQCYESAKIVIAAGLGSASLGRMVGLDVPLLPQRGQLLVTERLRPLLPMAASGLRQTAEGTVMIGVTQESVGYDVHTTSSAAARVASRALRILPDLARARLIRHWSCLRILTPDGCPVYADSVSHPGAWLATCHSGVTLAAFHAGPLSDCLDDSMLTADLNFFHHERFNVSTTI